MNKLVLFVLMVGATVFLLYFIQNGIPENLLPPQQQQKQLPAPQLTDPVQPVNPNPQPTPPAPTPPAPTPPVGPNVLDVLKPAFIQAQQQNKKVFLMITMDGCIHCERMKRDTLPRVDMTPYVYFETKDRSVVSQYNVTAFPTYIVLDNTGREIKRHTGFLGPVEFRLWLNR